MFWLLNESFTKDAPGLRQKSLLSLDRNGGCYVSGRLRSKIAIWFRVAREQLARSNDPSKYGYVSNWEHPK